MSGAGRAVVRRAEVLPRRDAPASGAARIAVLVSLNFPGLDEETAELVRRFTRVALETLREVGADFVLVDTSTALADPDAVADHDGLLLLGGGDIDPACYGAPGQVVPHAYGIDRRADEDALAALRAAEGAGLPILGICRGAQLVNVARGGTVLADLEDYTLHHGAPGEPLFLDEPLSIVPDSRVRALLGSDRIVVRSGHHQAVDRVGRGLRAVAYADDGVIEAVEDPDAWVVAVQWHPEDDDGPAEDRRRLFAGFVAACARRRTEVAVT